MRPIAAGPPRPMVAPRPLLVGVVVAVSLLLGACSGTDDEAGPAGTAPGPSTPASTEAPPASVDDQDAAFDRLADMAEAGMTPEEIEAALAALAQGGAPPPAGVEPIVGVFGDSSALTTALGLDTYGVDHPEVLYVDGGATSIGCGLVAAGTRRHRGELQPIPGACATWLEEWRAGAEATEMDVALVQLGPWEVVDTALPGNQPFLHIGQAALDRHLRAQLDAGLDALVDAGLLVVVLTSPPFRVAAADDTVPDPPFPESEVARVEAWNSMLVEAADARAGEVAVVDLGGYVEGLPAGEDERLRPDGIHFTAATAEEVAADWLAAEIRAAWESR